MPAFEFDGHTFNNPVELALHVIGGKWKMPILWRLQQRAWRYSELRRDLPAVNHKMLTQQLRELERMGLVSRTVFPVIPPHVEYALTPLGASTLPCIEQLRSWGTHYREAMATSGAADASDVATPDGARQSARRADETMRAAARPPKT